jgi:hypothetical protein
MNVPSVVRSYARAKQIHDGITPIRGNPNNVRPLGNRRDWHTYSVRVTGDDVEFVLYKTPVVTYKPDGIIEIRSGGWDSISTRQFIEQVLGINCYGRRGKSIVEVKGLPLVLGPDDVIRVRADANGYIVLAQDRPTIRGYRINRAASNNVRARYKDFYDYLKGFVGVRSAPVTLRYGRVTECVSFSVQEAADMLGTVQERSGSPMINREPFAHILQRPSEVYPHWRKLNQLDVLYPEGCTWFTELIGSGDHQKFYKAAMALLLLETGTMLADDGRLSVVFNVESSKLLTMLDSILMRWHADEVLVLETLADGKLPNPKYEKWFDKEE